MIYQHHTIAPIDDLGLIVIDLDPGDLTNARSPYHEALADINPQARPSLVSTTLLIQKKILHIETSFQTSKQGYINHSALSLSTTLRSTTSRT
jgi:hypothetical protein